MKYKFILFSPWLFKSPGKHVLLMWVPVRKTRRLKLGWLSNSASEDGCKDSLCWVFLCSGSLLVVRSKIQQGVSVSRLFYIL